LKHARFTGMLTRQQMNFFGHAALAAQTFRELAPAELGLICAGAMLPDFVSMLGLRRPQVRDPALARGVDFHHRTDHAFHELPSFQHLSREAFAWLSQQELPRGPARAVAHVGIEILLDEVMAEDAFARDSYCTALALPLAPHLVFASETDAGRLDELAQTLLARAPFSRHPAAELVAARIRRTLARRPRLATDDRGEQLLGSWVSVTRPLVAHEAPRLLSELRARLAQPTGAG
jgi:hypothetical protein